MEKLGELSMEVERAESREWRNENKKDKKKEKENEGKPFFRHNTSFFTKSVIILF